MTLLKSTGMALAILALAVPAHAQVFKLSRDQMIQYTSGNPFERFPDGRPKVPDALLERVKDMTMEEVWGLEHLGYPSQYTDGWKIVRPDKKLVGRAVTMLLMPLRQEVADVDSTGEPSKAPREKQITHQSVLDILQKGDVIVVDAHAIPGSIIGDNLANYINDVGAGFVIDGQVRDLDGIREIGMTGYYREAVPPPITNAMVAGINVPITIGRVTVMPGDVVLGDAEGVYFIPPKAVKELVDKADTTHIHDEWTRMKFAQGAGTKYKSTDIYYKPHDPALEKEYEQYLKEHLDELHKQRGEK